ncbi:MAG TPA: hypothetical protein PKD28_00350 [Candidatus Saccharibacteria bacterium]|nr:hypothetical protein [Candidatus Saccharibacteria bacterium]
MDSNQPNLPTEPQQPVAPAPAPVGPQPQPQMAYAQPPQSKKPKKGLIIGSIIAGALVVFGGAGALVYNVWYQNPEKVIFDALTHAFKSESATGTGTVAIKSDDVDLKITFAGEGQGSDGRVDTTIKFDSKSSGENISINVMASVLVKGETIYFKLDNVQKTVDQLAEAYGMEVPEYVTPIIKKIDGQWVSVKSSDYEDVSKEVAKQQRCVTDVFDNLSNSKDMKNELVDLYKENQILVIDEELPAKKIDGVGSLGYEISADTNAAQGFIKGLDDTEFGKELKKCDDSVNFAEVADAIKEADKENDSDVDTKFELWVSRFGHQITEVNFTVKDDDASGVFVFNPKFNQDVAVEAPKSSITIKQLQEDIEKAVEEYYSTLFDDSSYDYSDELSSPYNLN